MSQGAMICLVTYKVVHGIEPGYLRYHITPKISVLLVHSNRVGILQISSLKQCYLSGPQKHAFSLMVPILWNEAPTEIQVVPTLMVFWRV